MADIVSKVANKPIQVKQVPLESATQNMPRGTSIDAYEADSLERMFLYYTRHGLTGSPNVLGFVLGRPPTTYEAFVRRSLSKMAEQLA